MRIATCLLLSLAAGAGVYTAAAVLWSLVDPQGAGRTLLFTIPIAVVTMAMMGLLAVLAMVMPFDVSFGRRTAQAPAKLASIPTPAAVHHHADDPDLAIAA